MKGIRIVNNKLLLWYYTTRFWDFRCQHARIRTLFEISGRKCIFACVEPIRLYFYHGNKLCDWSSSILLCILYDELCEVGLLLLLSFFFLLILSLRKLYTRFTNFFTKYWYIHNLFKFIWNCQQTKGKPKTHFWKSFSTFSNLCLNDHSFCHAILFLHPGETPKQIQKKNS